jgi:hypothetical protein
MHEIRVFILIVLSILFQILIFLLIPLVSADMSTYGFGAFF